MALTHELTDGLESDVGRGRRLYEWVRDEIPHSNYQSHWTCHAQSKRTFWRCFMGRRIWTLVWLWGYHGGVLDLWESNMSGPFGDISNSNRDPNDLPLLDKTYTVYHYNYQRGASEAVEDHMHQIEAVLNSVDGRDRTPPDQWDKLLFWGRFVGSDRTHKIVPPGCGWAHYPPNAEQDYDWANKRYVETDIEDWKPDGSGKKQRMNCDRWVGDSLKWSVYWMQNIPGADNGLVYQDRRLSNWWIFIGDSDNAMRQRVGLIEAAGRHRQLP
jgi:hypothetical protein